MNFDFVLLCGIHLWMRKDPPSWLQSTLSKIQTKPLYISTECPATHFLRLSQTKYSEPFSTVGYQNQCIIDQPSMLHLSFDNLNFSIDQKECPCNEQI